MTIFGLVFSSGEFF